MGQYVIKLYIIMYDFIVFNPKISYKTINIKSQQPNKY